MCARPRFHDVLTHVRIARPDILDPIAAISERRLVVGGVIVTHPGTLVRSDAPVSLRAGRLLAGQRKLDAALTAFALDVREATCVDLGAAAGGFTRSLLDHGAALVYAIDVGFGQLAGSLRADPRVVALERTNLADAAAHIPVDARVDALTADLSFISLARALPQVTALPYARDAILVALVKPQFELGLDRPPVGRRDLDRAFVAACAGAQEAGWLPGAGMRSPIRGGRGSEEYVLLARRRPGGG